MAKNYDKLSETIVKSVGGTENISALTHCVTRLRFTLVDESKADTKTLEQTEGILKIIQAGGQYQVVIGNEVGDVFDAICAKYNLGPSDSNQDTDSAQGEKKGVINNLMNIISGILAPTLGVLAAAGIVKGLVSLGPTLGWFTTESGFYMVLYALSDGFFYFLPILLGFTSARKFKSNEFVGAAIGCALVYPGMVNIATTLNIAGTIFAGTAFEMNYYNTFLGIPIVMPGTGYTSSVVPIILAVYVASRIEKLCKKSIPVAVRGVLTPLFSLVCAVVLTYIVIGPVSMAICGVIANFVTFLYHIPVVGGVVAGALIGGGFGILVMFGLHWVIISLGLSTIAINGFDYMLACGSIGPMIGMFQGIALCIASRKNRKVRDLAIPATISQVCGIGEPLMYSVMIPLKKPLVLNIVGGAIGGAILGLLQTKIFMFGGSGLFSFPNFVNPATGSISDMIKYVIAVLIAGVFTFVTQLIIYKDKDAEILG
ncbi:PTS transporter subunit EIIC [Konateibacter massiliensis]|uniref:PTS transporter subunit EIIC n=1 Tax=Konateibacter massiliensis TaxID=2002841 RepID=UPI000C14D35A|nr:PTS transporter subunit EIIC [Konateibacter massiliensis]